MTRGPRPALRWVLAALGAAALLSACAAASQGAAAPVRTDTVTMVKSYRFAPAVIEVPAGTTVTWRNEDNFTHSVRLVGKSDTDRLVRPGERTTIRFTEQGEYPYECSLHPRDMRGKVIVTAAGG
jgi:plastocyanin